MLFSAKEGNYLVEAEKARIHRPASPEGNERVNIIPL
jgi:hypothetical protein